MGLRNRVQKNVDKAFKSIGDLVEKVTITSAKSESFDFNTNSVTIKTVPPREISGVKLSKRTVVDGQHTIRVSYMFKSVDLPTPEIYDTIKESDGTIWKPVAPYTNDGYIVTMDVVRESLK